METKPYPEAKRRILIQRSASDFITFLEEITDREGKRFVYNHLLPRKVPGFREGRVPAGFLEGRARLTQTVPMLISKLKNERELTNCDSSIWNSFKNAWISWVESHQELNNILLEFNNEADFDENHKCVEPPNSELDIRCFKILLKANRDNLISQETIRRFYEYGYFNEDERIEDLIDKALPQKEIERRQRLEELPDQVDRLCQEIDELRSQVSGVESHIDRLCQEIDELRSQVSGVESYNELKQAFDLRIAEIRQSFEMKLRTFDRRIAEEIRQSFESQFSESNFTQMVSQLGQLINSLESRLVKLEESIKSPVETQPSATEFKGNIKKEIDRLNRQIQEVGQSVEVRSDAIDQAIVEIKAKVEKVCQTTDAPRIAYRAVEIGKHHATKLREEKETYEDEYDYLSDFKYSLRRFGITNSDETAAAIHVALKAFPALEVADPRIIKVWGLMCNNHLHLTKINVEMGWLGLQDWFPYFFSDECFSERLERINLDISIRKMCEMGDMLWAIYFSNCDRSFPEGYLSPFLNWIDNFSKGAIKVFLTRCSGTNRCETNEDVYAWAARLPKPESREPLEAQKLKSSGVIVTQTEWESWCRPNPEANSQFERHLEFLDRLRSAIENEDAQIPMGIFREILQYLRLSHNIMASTRALDWALTLRLLPWIGNRSRLIDVVRNLVNEENQEFPHFQDGLQKAREVNK